MEVYVLLGLVSLGYMFTKKKDQGEIPEVTRLAEGTESVSSRDKELPLKRRYQAGKTYNDVRTEELLRAQDAERAARFPLQTGAVDPRNRKYGENVLDTPVRSELAGVDFSAADFRHTNMQPFFGGHLKSARNDAHTGALLETFAGAPGVGNSQPKREVPALFKPEERNESTNVYGNQNYSTALQDRFDDMNMVNRVKNNQLPFEQVRVGPGVGQGYTSLPSGGFGHPEDREFIMGQGYYKDVNELRPGNKPKESYKLRPNPGVVPSGARGSIGQVSKNTPDTSFNIEEFGMVPTTGQAEAQRIYPDPLGGRKLANKPTTFRVEGAGPTGNLAAVRPMPEGISNKIGEPKFQTETPELTNVGRIGAGNKAAEDMLRMSEGLDENERTLSQGRWEDVRMMNMRSTYPGHDVRAQWKDGLRLSGKEHMADAAASHMFGVMSPQAPSRGPAYDPVLHRPRTTLKETQIHDSRRGNYKNEAGTYGDDGDWTRHTVREGYGDTYDTYSVRNPNSQMVQEGMGAPNADPRDHRIKTTTKELTVQNEYVGGVAPGEFVPDGGYQVDAMGIEEARFTNRQFTDQNEYYGSGGRPDDTGYGPTHVAMKKNMTSMNNKPDFEYYGISKHNTEKGVDLEFVYNSTLNEAKQALLENRVPGGHAGPKQSPVVERQGDMYLNNIVYNEDYTHNPSMPKERATDQGSLKVQDNTGLSYGDRIDEQLLSWLNSNPLVATPVVRHDRAMLNSQAASPLS
ncbi:hypothetical protein TetV_273 [Tetraselmis virus 1]|uniref:Uncharacterized protein n=1 Tax=Tetraselmis virus 1 TaxID=2060617 RepID=A0A2P0VN81_9VIRU|nr:hypothetical protein QJ968_gp273 [Tetraselmis virus 1]AUF82365.1 hypothetical protein TetV_273 [Tetraselmis virus 1]